MDDNAVSVTLCSEQATQDKGCSDLQPSNDRDTLSSDGEVDILALQVRAFLESAGDVDVDTETIEDILQTLFEHTKDDEDVQSQHSAQDDAMSSQDGTHEHPSQEIDISPLFKDKNNVVGNTWPKEEVKKMMHLLKEKGSSAFIDEYIKKLGIPVPKLLHAFGIDLCPQLHNRAPKTMLYFLNVALVHQLRKRDKLPQYNTISDVVDLIRKSQRILILTGAGISVSCGIPDFRSRDGLYASLKKKGDYDLDDPQQMFDINYFKENPSAPSPGSSTNPYHNATVLTSNQPDLPFKFHSFAMSPVHKANRRPGQTPSGEFKSLFQDGGDLTYTIYHAQNYTQNIDTLETQAGVHRVLQCHGSFAMATCLHCRTKVVGSKIEADIMRHKVPLCTVCNPDPTMPLPPKGKKSKKKAKGQWDSDVEDESDGPEYPPGIMKPDITFFGEKLTDDFDKALAEDRFKVDLLLIIGTSLKVSPVAEIVSHLPHSIPQILINKTPISHINPDIALLGNADEIILHLCQELEWDLPAATETPNTTSSDTVANRLYPPRANLKKRMSTDDADVRKAQAPKRVGESHVWLFDGAEGGKWLQNLQRELGIAKSRSGSRMNSRHSTPVSTPNQDPDARREAKKPRVM